MPVEGYPVEIEPAAGILDCHATPAIEGRHTLCIGD
jgi:hypothetical protein